MWLKVVLLLVVVCTCLTFDVTANFAGGQFPRKGFQQEQRPGSNLGSRDEQSRGGQKNKGKDNFPGLLQGRNGRTDYARSETQPGKTAPNSRRQGHARFRRDYGYGFNRGYLPGGGFYGPGGYGGGDFGRDYGSDGWRRE